jgi:hypothetical protein
MFPIKATLQLKDANPAVVNLQDALLALLENALFQVYEAPNSPTREELDGLIKALKQERKQSLYGDATQRLIFIFQIQQGLGDNLGGTVEEKTANLLNVLLKELGLLDEEQPESGEFVVRGHIIGANSGDFVRAFDKDFRSEEPLGASPIVQGSYEIRYSRDQFMRAEKGSADLRVAVCEPGGRELVSSEIYYNPAPEMTIDLVARSEPTALSEYKRYLAELEGVLQGVTLFDIANEDPAQQEEDIDFLSGDTGINREHIVWLVQAAQLVREADQAIPPEIPYSWFRMGLPTSWEALQLQRINILRRATLDAIAQNIIAAWLRDDLESILARVPNLQARELTTVLGGATLSQEKILNILTQIDNVDAVSDTVLKELVEKQVLNAEEVQRVGLSVSLHRLAGGDQPIISTMLKLEFSSIETGRLQRARDLATLEPEDWERALEESAWESPNGVSRKQYARSLAIGAAGEFPQTGFVHRTTRIPTGIEDQLSTIQPLLEKNEAILTRDFSELDFEGISDEDRKSLRAAHTDLRHFANIHPGLGLYEVMSRRDGGRDVVEQITERIGWLRTVFDLNQELSLLSLDYLPNSSDLQSINFGSLEDDARAVVLSELKAQQRIYSVTNNPIPSLEIMRAGFHSASAIALTRVQDFAEATGLPEGEASAYHVTARERGNTAAIQYFKLFEIARDKHTTPVRAIPSISQFFEPLKGFADLIKDQPWCDCEHCQSVLSPAAYFVDLMYYIEQNILKDSFKGKETHPLHLQIRRPDLWELDLTCKNTTEYVPYLDVVNEILERYLWEILPHPAGANPLTFIYRHLADQEGAFQQPFTFPIERLEILLGHFDLSRYNVAKAMGSSREVQARVRLKLSQKEYELITQERTSTSDLAFFKKLFKLNASNTVATADTILDPIEMHVLLTATALDHEVVERVLKTEFVNKDGSNHSEIKVDFGKRYPSDVQNNTELVTQLTLKRLDRIHRFIRLWRVLPWTIEELDYVLTRLVSPEPIGRIEAGTSVTTGTLEKILDLLDLNAAWSLPVDELLALTDAFPTKGLREEKTLFDRLFNQTPFLDRDGQWPNILPITFSHPAWAKQANTRSGSSNPNNNTLSRLLAGLQITDKELLTLIASLTDIPEIHPPIIAPADETIVLNHTSIGILYRHACLMRLLKCQVTDFVKLVKLTPRIEARPLVERYIRDLHDVKSVVEFAAWHKTSGFDLDEILYVTGASLPEDALDPATLAKEIIERLKTEKSLEFVDTVFTQIGLTELQSRQILLANLGKKDKAFEKMIDGNTYRLKADFDLAAKQVVTVDPSIDPPIDPPIDNKLIGNLLRSYHALEVLDVVLGSALKLEPEETRELREMAHPLDTVVKAAAIVEGLQAGDPTSLTDLLTPTLRFRTLFKSDTFQAKGKVTGKNSLNFVRNNLSIFFALPGNASNRAITVEVVRNVAAYAALGTATNTHFNTASEPVDIEAIHQVLTGVSTATNAVLAKTLRTDEARISALKPHLDLSRAQTPFEALDVLAQCLMFTERLGVSGETLSLMVKEDSSRSATFENLSRAAEDVFGAFRAKYPDEKTFHEKIEPFEDRLRARKRDGLVNFIVSQWSEPFADANKLYEYFLIDVLLEGCARTSRLVAAISSLQLYVHRVLINLEWSKDWKVPAPGSTGNTSVYVRFTDSKKQDEWYWRKNYRVWEANRKVFLYPENYIEPELRDDKSPLFKELEDTLLQQEINESNLYDAYAKFLTGFDEVAHLKIAGAYYEPTVFDPNSRDVKIALREDTLHLFGVTQDSAAIYYYRTIENTRSETPRLSAWRKLNLQVPVHKVSPIVFEGRLFVFWLETTTRPHSIFEDGRSVFSGYRHSIRVKYAVLRPDGFWSPPQSLVFANGDALEETRIVYDPLPKDVSKAKEALEQRIEDVNTNISNLENTETDATNTLNQRNREVTTAQNLLNAPPSPKDESDAVHFAAVAAAGATAMAVLAVFGGPPAQIAAFASAWWGALAVEVGISMPDLVAAGVNMFDPLYIARRKHALWQARILASLAATNRNLIAGTLNIVRAEKTRLENAIKHLNFVVRWDKSKRDHREPLDNYKPEGWEWDRVYPEVFSPPNAPQTSYLRLMLVPRNEPVPTIGVFQLLPSDEVDLSAGVLRQLPSTSSSFPETPTRISNLRGNLRRISSNNITYGGQEFYIATFWLNDLSQNGAIVALAPSNADVQIVNGESKSVIIDSKLSLVWMREAISSNSYIGTRLRTTLTATLMRAFSRKGPQTLLDAGFQAGLQELPLTISPVSGQSDPEKRNPFYPANPYQNYFRETFFHVPALIANHLNSTQKFAASQRWYHSIFDPTAADGLAWRYREFRDLSKTSQSLRAMLTDINALRAYREDPFNPHAIARNRLTAYQKSIIMKYVDNLLDWGDSLFSQFTMESVNEATMLYVMAQDILGPKPMVLGSCGEGNITPKNYKTIRERRSQISDFLIELEATTTSVVPGERVYEYRKYVTGGTEPVYLRIEATNRTMSVARALSTPSAPPPGAGAGGLNPEIEVSAPDLHSPVVGSKVNPTGTQYWTNEDGIPLQGLYQPNIGNGVGTVLGTDSRRSDLPPNVTGNIDFVRPGSYGVPGGDRITHFDEYKLPIDVRHTKRDFYDIELPKDGFIPDTGRQYEPFDPVEMVPPKDLLFCIPPNKDLLAYWGRVEDRLYKIRNCMDIVGVRRSLDLFAPEIDPRLLVRMKAAGLTLEDVLNATSGNVPPYRFTYLIEKTKQYVSTLQSFGSQLLSAIEKRDGEELAQLRAVHEQHLLQMRSRMMQMEIDAAEDTLASLVQQKLTLEYRRYYYKTLSQTGQIAPERKQQELQRMASAFKTQAGLAQVVASILTIIPDMGAPTAMKFGGSQLGAAGRAVAEGLNALAAYNEMGASRAGVEASNLRRDQEWRHQVQLATHEIEQIKKQITAAELKQDIAKRSREVHDKTAEQSEEMFNFLRDKFSNFGMYSYLSSQLHRLYRSAFNSAFSMVRMTEQAYRAERTDDATILNGNYWDAGHSGLLAGERLLMDLQSLEQRYIETNCRQLEIEQSFSLAQLAPDELATLRLTGECSFNIPEWFFDLTYPGQYRRRLKAVRLTIPCVTGPYTNVGATLRLERSMIRSTLPSPLLPATSLPEPDPVLLRHTVKIATSKGQYDAGVFDFNFRDERLMPFEGAGAISGWNLFLPKTMRMFDYNTISDVVVHLSYTAEYDNLLKENREAEAAGIISHLRAVSMKRWFSLRNECPDVFHRVLTSPLNTKVDFTIEERHFPFFLMGSLLEARLAKLHIISPLNSLRSTTPSVPNTTWQIGMKKADSLEEPDFRTVEARSDALEGVSLNDFDFGDILYSQATPKGIAATVYGDYVIMLMVAGVLAPDSSDKNNGIIDPVKLHDIVIEIEYSLAQGTGT